MSKRSDFVDGLQLDDPVKRLFSKSKKKHQQPPLPEEVIGDYEVNEDYKIPDNSYVNENINKSNKKSTRKKICNKYLIGIFCSGPNKNRGPLYCQACYFLL